MRLIDCDQRSEAWFQARSGIPTASEFGKIITPKTMKLSSQSQAYAYQLLAERQMGASVSSFSTAMMDRGTQLEPEAVAWYEFTHNVDVQPVGFCLLDDGTAGASTDGLVGEDGILECKCLGDGRHFQATVDPSVDAEYAPQVQGGLWVTGRAWCDLVFYHPALPPVAHRQHRDERYITAIASAVGQFNQRLEEQARRLGI